MTTGERDLARRVAIAELVHAAELCAKSGLESVRALGAIHLRRAVKIARGQTKVAAFTRQDIAAFLKWWATR